jgi:hypothetical protein
MSSSPAKAAAALRARVRIGTKLALALAAMWFVLVAQGGAQGMQVPATVQAGLLAKVAGFDRNFPARANGTAIILVVQNADDPESVRAAGEMKSALSQISQVGNLPHEEVRVSFTNAAALAELVRSKRAAIVYLGPGFGKQAQSIRDALSSLSVLSFGADPEYVPAGIVLGVDLVSGRPKLLVNIPQARKQQVSFPASVLNLMKVYP